MLARVFASIVAVLVLSAFTAHAGAPPPPKRGDINTATLKDLTGVKGIGQKMAVKILAHRESVGKFTSMHQLKEVKGIGKATFAKLACSFSVVEEGELPCNLGGDGKKVNLNAASVKELTTLPGVGKKKAATIIQYRTEQGWFQSPYDLTNIKGIGKKSVQNLLHLLEVKVDINQARAAHFEALGFTNGDAIIEARQKLARFKSVDDLAKVPDVDQKVFEKAKVILVVNPAK